MRVSIRVPSFTTRSYAKHTLVDKIEDSHAL